MPPDGRKRQKPDQNTMKEIIHSGHFMVSDIDDSEIQEGEDSPSLVVHESDCDQESLPLPARGFDFESACKETSKTYTFGSRSNHSISIDASLTKLFECMTLAYSGKLTSPRWKQFKGLKLRLKEKIRLNNMIWRAWHMQFVMKIKTDKLCQFASPLDGDTHMKPEAVVIEGTYWKRRMANITAEYQKWRLFYRDRFRMKPSQDDNVAMDLDTRWPSWPKEPYSSLQSAMDEDLLMDFSDTLFSSLNASQPFDFPNPREIAAKAGIADFIQPGLVQLQPSVDDFMDTLEPLSDLFSDFLNSKLPTLPEESTYNSNSMPEMFSSSSYQPDVLGILKQACNQNNSVNVFNQSPAQTVSSKRNNNHRKSTPRLFQSQRVSPSIYPGKSVLEAMNSSSASSSILSDNVPLLPSAPSSANVMQPFMCNQPSEESNLALLTGLQQTHESLPSNLQVSAAPLTLKTEQTSPFLQQTSYLSNVVDVPASSIQVPLEPIPQGQLVESDAKNSKHPLFFSVSLGQMNQTFGQAPAGSFKLPLQLATGSVPQMAEQSVLTREESPAFRRHSYTTGQHVQASSLGSGDYMSTRRSRPIAPAGTNGNFIVPEVPQSRQRTRSRSVSSPQSGSPKPYPQQSVQAVSLTDISSGSHPPKREPSSTVLSQSAVLAQLLSSGCTQELGPAVIKVSTATTGNVTSPVTIIRPILSTTAHTFVFSPLPAVTTAAGVSNFQRTLFSNTADPRFSSRNSPPTRVISAPDSPGSSTCSSSPAIPAISFEASPPSKSSRPKSDEEKIQYKEHRRVCHINAEQKRRCNIKNGFESLHNLLPPVGQTPSAKISKAAMLQRGAEYIRTLKTERQQQLEEVERLKKQIDELNQAISVYQSQLPASGAPVPCQRTNKMKEMFEEYVRQQTLQNWKFWIFSLIVEPLVDSFNSNVSTASIDEMCKSILTWLDQHCSLVSLRPGVLNSLRHLSTTTNILSDPSRMPEEATRAVTKKEKRQH